jgi:hypothetical protein
VRFLPARKALKQTNITGTIAIGTIIIITDNTSTTEDIGPIGTASRSSIPFKPRSDRRTEFTSVVLADFTLGRASHFLPERSGGTIVALINFDRVTKYKTRRRHSCFKKIDKLQLQDAIVEMKGRALK